MFAVTASAHAANFQWNWTAPPDAYKLSNSTGNSRYTSPEGIAVNDHGGEIQAISASFNSNTNQLTWMVTLGPTPSFQSDPSRGFTLALTDGPNPKGVDGELALIYFDAHGPSPILTAYAYNGINGSTSYFDGSGAAGVQAPDPIVSSLLNNQISLFDTTNPNGSRTLGFSMDASLINQHVPMHGNPNDWTGMSFSDSIGIWFHPAIIVEGTYSQGFLTNWRTEVEGWFDGANVPTVPEPSAALLMLSGALAAAIRRRR